MPRLVHLDRDHWLDQNQAAYHDRAVEQGQDLQPHPQLPQLHHVRRARTRLVGEGDVVRHELQRRKHRQFGRPGNLEIASGRLFDQGGEPVLVSFDWDDKGDDDGRGDDKRDEHRQAYEQFLHAAPPR